MADEIMFLTVTRMSFYPILTINCHRDVFISNFNGAHNVVILPLKLQLHVQGQARGTISQLGCFLSSGMFSIGFLPI